MENSLSIIADMISIWWDFIWATDVPGTNFSFGALYAFVLVLSLGLYLMHIALNHKDGSDNK